jgi:hypothetical protein
MSYRLRIWGFNWLVLVLWVYSLRLLKLWWKPSILVLILHFIPYFIYFRANWGEYLSYFVQTHIWLSWVIWFFIHVLALNLRIRLKLPSIIMLYCTHSIIHNLFWPSIFSPNVLIPHYWLILLIMIWNILTWLYLSSKLPIMSILWRPHIWNVTMILVRVVLIVIQRFIVHVVPWSIPILSFPIVNHSIVVRILLSGWAL